MPAVASLFPAAPAPRRPFALARDGVRHDVSSPTTWPALDGIRGIAIVAVVVWHAYRFLAAGVGAAARSAEAHPLGWVLGSARFSIDAFFVLSGFLVVGSWEALRRRHPAVGTALWSYWKRRLLRVFPGYWLSLAVFLPLLAPSLLSRARAGDLALFVTAQSYLKSGLPAEVNVPYWSLTTELQFYLLVPLIALLLNRIGRWPLLAGALALSTVWAFTTPFGMPPSLLPGRIDQFLAGAVAGQLVAAHASGGHPLVDRLCRRGVGTALVALILALGTHHGSTFGYSRGAWIDPLLTPIVGLALAGLVIRVAVHPPRLLERPVVRTLGITSYGTYLWHYPLLLLGFRATGGTASWTAAAVQAALVVLSFALGWLSYALVERRFLAARRAAANGPLPAETVPLVPDRGTRVAGAA